jgi:remodeling and spacing factor 1
MEVETPQPPEVKSEPEPEQVTKTKEDDKQSEEMEVDVDPPKEGDEGTDNKTLGGLIQTDHLSSECLDDPNFAIICSFLENFGQHIRLGEFPYDELQMMLENTTEGMNSYQNWFPGLLYWVWKLLFIEYMVYLTTVIVDILVPDRLVKLHIALLRRVFKTITPDKWERSVAKFGHTYCNQDGWEIERFGYKKAKLPTKLRILKNLLEAQFDYNVKFKAEVNKLEAGDLRLIPLGK